MNVALVRSHSVYIQIARPVSKLRKQFRHSEGPNFLQKDTKGHDTEKALQNIHASPQLACSLISLDGKIVCETQKNLFSCDFPAKATMDQ